jgi:hypothetical protein
VPETSTTVYIAIMRPDPAALGQPTGTVEMPSLQTPLSLMSLAQLIELAVVAVVLLGAGIWLGRGPTP